MTINRLERGVERGRMAAHAEIIVRTPDSDVARLFAGILRPPERVRKTRRAALEIGEDAVTLLIFQFLDRGFEMLVVVLHDRVHCGPPADFHIPAS